MIDSLLPAWPCYDGIMAYTEKMEFQFEAEVANLTTGEKYKLSEGKPATITVRRGNPNSVLMKVVASNSGQHGSNPDPDKDDEKGFPFVTTYEYTWTVDVEDSGQISTIGTPKEVTKTEEEFPETSKKARIVYDKSNTKYIVAEVQIDYTYFVDAMHSGEQQFMCKLVAEKPKEPPKPKIRKETVEVGSFAFGDATVQKIKSIGRMMDYSKLSAWYNKLPERTRNTILSGKPPGGQKVVLTGYTDNVGDEHFNFALGTKRAVAVAQTLEKISGVKWSDFVATPSKGEQDVRTEEKNLEKKEPKHRRVEVTIFIEE